MNGITATERSAAPTRIVHQVQHQPPKYAVDLDEESGEDGFGGMDLELYDAIVRFKKTGEYPAFSDPKTNRNAHFHWRNRCATFILENNHSDTLMYIGPGASQHRVVVRRGEVRTALKIIHERNGHSGQKITFRGASQRLYWKSMRRDVIRYLNDCDVCRKKKMVRREIANNMYTPDMGVDVLNPSRIPRLSPHESVIADRLLLTSLTRLLDLPPHDAEVYDFVDEDGMFDGLDMTDDMIEQPQYGHSSGGGSSVVVDDMYDDTVEIQEAKKEPVGRRGVSVLKRARAPEKEEGVKRMPDEFAQPSTPYDYYPSHSGASTSQQGPQQAQAARRGRPPVQSTPAHFDVSLAPPSLSNPAMAAPSTDREVVRLQKSVLLLQQEVLLLKRQYLRAKLDQMNYFPHGAQIVVEQVVDPEPELGGNEEVADCGNVDVEQ